MSPSRNDIETATTCPVCHLGFEPVRRQRYCTPACRQAAWRARNTSTDLNTVSAPVLPNRGRREHTVYACTECDHRYLAQQWCEDRTLPCVRIGLGGICPCCDEPVTIDELLNLHNDDITAQNREKTASTKLGAVQCPARCCAGCWSARRPKVFVCRETGYSDVLSQHTAGRASGPTIGGGW